MGSIPLQIKGHPSCGLKNDPAGKNRSLSIYEFRVQVFYNLIRSIRYL